MKQLGSNKVEQLRTWIRGIEFAMLTTEDRMGNLRSRPMVVLDDMTDGALWFFSEASSHKVDDIHGHHSVNLSYAGADGGKFVSVTGRARIVRDYAQTRKLWRSKLQAWFPKGADDPELILLRVEVTEAELWQSPERQFEVKVEVGNPGRNAHELLTFA